MEIDWFRISFMWQHLASARVYECKMVEFETKLPSFTKLVGLEKKQGESQEFKVDLACFEIKSPRTLMLKIFLKPLIRNLTRDLNIKSLLKIL